LIVASFLKSLSLLVMHDVLCANKKQLKVVIADDSAAVRELLKPTLSRIDGLHITGMAENGVEALQLVKELNPDVLVLDISMPKKSGIDVLKEIRKDHLSTVIIMFSAEPTLCEFCLASGADYFLQKTEIMEMIDIFSQLLGN